MFLKDSELRDRVTYVADFSFDLDQFYNLDQFPDRRVGEAD